MALTLKDTITWEAWANSRAVGEGTRYRRKHVLDLWARANGAKSPTEVLDQIILEKVNLYDSVVSLLNNLWDQDAKPSTVALYRSMFPEFFESVLGENNFSRSRFDRLVEVGDNYVSVTKKAPTVAELQHLLRIANPRDRALLAVLANTGARIGEIISRRMSEIEERNGGKYARIKLQAKATKSRFRRTIFLTKETLQFIRDYHSGIKSEGVFPGGEGRVPEGRERVKTDHHLAAVTS